MNLRDLNLIKKSREIDAIKDDLFELKNDFSKLITCLESREKTLLESIDKNSKFDLATADLIEKQQAAIAKLESLNNDKEKKLSGLGRWLILGVLGALSLTVQYSLKYDKGTGLIVKPNTNAGVIIPSVYALAIIAVATHQDSKIGLLIERIGDKIG